MNKLTSLIQKIHIHPLLWIVILLAVATAHFMELCLLLLIIFIHEMGHAVAASFFSWRIKRISILPFGGVAEMDEHGNRPLKEDVIVTIAGPIQHLWLMLAGYWLYNMDIISLGRYELFIEYNLMVLIFNLLPIWPLDGGKLIFLLFSLKHSFPQAHGRTLLISMACIILFIISVLLVSPLNLNVWIVISFILISLYTEWKQQRYIFMRFLLERYYGKKDTFSTLESIMVDESDFIMDVLGQFQRGKKHLIVVRKEGKEMGTLDENELLHAYFTEKQLTAKISDLLFPY
ncbi:M50 family metallopeptidase [Bacillus sp. CGMCC 1.16607]|uniref:M50 family metallopeptidase n=1 Tax=Bacillus sp. CGMCC 1.16607 TaxID=3351842 RepID=UPI003643B768